MRGREGGARAELGGEVSNALRRARGGGSRAYVLIDPGCGGDPHIRQITPLEGERLAGLPDGHTQIPWEGAPAAACPDAPRFEVLGNGLAIPDVRWLGARLLRFHRLKLLETCA